MATTTVEVLVDDLDGSPAAQTVQLGWNGQWRELDLSNRNLASLSRLLDKYWDAGRPVGSKRKTSRRRAATRATAKRDPKAIRAWAAENGVDVPARGRIPGAVEAQFNQAQRRS